MGFGVSSADTSSKTTEMKSRTDESGRYGKSVLIRWEDQSRRQMPDSWMLARRGEKEKKKVCVCGGGGGEGDETEKEREKNGNTTD